MLDGVDEPDHDGHGLVLEIVDHRDVAVGTGELEVQVRAVLRLPGAGTWRHSGPESLDGEQPERAGNRERQRDARRAARRSDRLPRLRRAGGKIADAGISIAQLASPADETDRVALDFALTGERKALIEEPDGFAMGSDGERVDPRLFQMIDCLPGPARQEVVVRKDAARGREIRTPAADAYDGFRCAQMEGPTALGIDPLVGDLPQLVMGKAPPILADLQHRRRGARCKLSLRSAAKLPRQRP